MPQETDAEKLSKKQIAFTKKLGKFLFPQIALQLLRDGDISVEGKLRTKSKPTSSPTSGPRLLNNGYTSLLVSTILPIFFRRLADFYVRANLN